MSRYGPALLIVAALVVMVGGMGGRLWPYQWFGVTVAEMVGYMILLVPVGAVAALLIVVWDRQRQLLRRWGNHERRLERLEGGRRQRGRVVRGPWEGSGS